MSPYPLWPLSIPVTSIQIHKVLVLFSTVYKNNNKHTWDSRRDASRVPAHYSYFPALHLHSPNKALILVSIVNKNIKIKIETYLGLEMLHLESLPISAPVATSIRFHDKEILISIVKKT